MKRNKLKRRDSGEFIPSSVSPTVEGRFQTLDLEYGHFSRELEIDKNHLDDALLKQPQLLARAGEIHAEVVSLRDGLKDQLEVESAKAQIDVRERATKKQNEGEIKARSILYKSRMRASKQYIQACGEAERWDSLQKSFRDRGFVLSTLSELWQSGYFSNSHSKASKYSAESQEDSIQRRRQQLKEKREEKRQRRISKRGS